MILRLLPLLCLLSISLTAQPTDPPVAGDWIVVDALTDDFEATDLNAADAKWVPRNHDTGPEGHRWQGRRPGRFFQEQSTVVNGRLRITATALYDPGDEQATCDYWMKTGFTYSKSKIELGWYTECLMQASDLSMASSFWCKLGTINNQEIDITETYGNGRNTRFWDDKIRSNTHVFLPPNNQDNASNPPPIDVADNEADFPRNRFVRVGMHRRSTTEMDIYVDGALKQTMLVAGGLAITEPLRLIWDMEPFVPACGSGPGAPKYEHIRPANPTRRNYMEVEWVKTWEPAAAFPVTWLSFSGQPEGKSITLEWATATETGNLGFQVAHKTGRSNWQPIGWVDARSPGNPETSYVFHHQPDGNGQQFYRLKQLDRDGLFSYSPVISVNHRGASAALTLYSNPVTTGDLRFRFTGNVDAGRVALYDSAGKQVRTAPASAGQLRVAGLPAGVYLLRLYYGGRTEVQRVILH